jgi:energy-coupling factor transport system ATP-binding protein
MIELDRIGFSYGTKKVLSNCSLRIEPDEIAAITGANGSGKSTLALLMAGILQPQEGRVLVSGTEMGSGRGGEALRRRIGIVFENPDNQFITTSVERELAFELENLGVEPGAMRKQVNETIERFSLGSIRNRAPHTLSGGEKQKVALAATLIANPGCLILDEPTIFLDPASRETVREMIGSLKGKMTIILFSQFPSELLLAESIYELRDGRLDGTLGRERIFELSGLNDPTVRFLQELREREIFKAEEIPSVPALCEMLEAYRKNR